VAGAFLSVLGTACRERDIAPTPATASIPRASALAQSLQRQTKAGSKPVRIVQRRVRLPGQSFRLGLHSRRRAFDDPERGVRRVAACGDAATITVPFVLDGFVRPEEFGDLLPVEGSGTATLELAWDTSSGNGGTWAIIRSRYEFNGAHRG
jgi:hypothetical protein